MAGAGIGGLACAQGLVRRGLDVQVVERDTNLAMTRGYQLHLRVPAVAALRKLLPATSFEALLGSSVGTQGFSLTVLDHRGRRLLRARAPSAGLSIDIDRITLRQILALGLDDRMLLGRSCQGWRVEGETVVAELDDGTELEADVLVIADGAGSKLAEQLAGRPTSFPCGLIGVAGRTPWRSLRDSTAALLGGGDADVGQQQGVTFFLERRNGVAEVPGREWTILHHRPEGHGVLHSKSFHRGSCHPRTH